MLSWYPLIYPQKVWNGQKTRIIIKSIDSKLENKMNAIYKYIEEGQIFSIEGKSGKISKSSCKTSSCKFINEGEYNEVPALIKPTFFSFPNSLTSWSTSLSTSDFILSWDLISTIP